MKKFGLTLAEVLVTVAIIGVVSALTVPQLSVSIQKKKWASALSTQITNFENATRNLIINSNAIDMYDTEILNQNTLSEDFPKYLKNLESYNEEDFIQFYKGKVYNINKEILNYYQLDRNIMYYINFNLKGGGTFL